MNIRLFFIEDEMGMTRHIYIRLMNMFMVSIGDKCAQ
jgi:hypothetical protein